MSQINCTRSGCKDVFHSYLVENADYEGNLEIPKIKTKVYRPAKVITFSKCISSKEYDAWVLFYEDDAAFERIWNNPRRYLPILSKFKGVISPDFSLYRDMPLVMQLWNIYRNRAIGCWLQENGICLEMPIEEAMSIDSSLKYNEEDEDFISDRGYWIQDDVESGKACSITVYLPEAADREKFFTYEWVDKYL